MKNVKRISFRNLQQHSFNNIQCKSISNTDSKTNVCMYAVIKRIILEDKNTLN